MRLTERAHKMATRLEEKEDRGGKLNRHERRFLEQYSRKAFGRLEECQPITDPT